MIIDISERSKEAMRNAVKSEEWIRLPVGAMQDKDLTPVDVLILSYIIDQTGTTEKPLSEKRIAEKVGISERHTKRSLKRLEETGYIIVNRRAGQKSLYRHTDVLPPKGQNKQKKKKTNSENDRLDLEKYKIFINQFPDTAEK